MFFFLLLHSTYLHIRYVGWGCILNCFTLSSLPCFCAFCWSAIPTPCNGFYSCSPAILHNNYISLLSDFVCMRTHEEKNGITKEAIVLQWVVWTTSWDFKLVKKVMSWCTAQWKMLLFCAKTIMKESHKFELARLKKKRHWVCCSAWKHLKMNGRVL